MREENRKENKRANKEEKRKEHRKEHTEESKKEKYKEVPMFIFICHMDTVVVGEGWTKNPFGAEIEEQNGILRMYGRGSCDMKSGLACALATF